MIIFIIFIIWIIVTLISGSLIFKSKNIINKFGEGSAHAVSIIIPARNEADNLPVLLKSILEQKDVSFEIIVANDGSSDRTADIARHHGAAVIDVPETDAPGKYFACFTGSRHAHNGLLLFMDADTYFSDEDSLSNLCRQYSSHHGRGILSIQPFHQIGKRHETLSAIFNLMTVAGINIFSIFKSKYEAGTVFGPVLLTNRGDYEKTGGHMAAKGYILEGTGMYEAYKAQGMPIYHHLGKDTVHFRMYSEGFSSMVNGWKKHISIGAENTGPAVMASIMIWLSSGLVFPVFLVHTLMFNAEWILVVAFLYLISSIQFHSLCRPVIDVKKSESAFYPVYQYFFFFVYTLSLYQTRIKKTVKWKGRNIKYEK